jgi:hypothetical protein
MVRVVLRRMVLDGRRAESARDVSGERGVFKIGDGRDGGVDGKNSDGWGRGEGNVQGIRGLVRRGEVGCGVATHSRWLVQSQQAQVSGLPGQRWTVWWG